VLIGLIRVLGFAVQAVIVLWMCLGFLGFAVAILAGVIGLFDRTMDVRVAPARPVPAVDLSAFEVPVETGSDGSKAHPPVTVHEPPAMAFLCGRSDGPVVHIVEACDGPVDLWGFAVEEPPQGPERDCVEGWLAYTREPGRWICWHAVPGETPDVRAWTAADGEWFDEDGG
jgi:hypothetical protein